MGVQFQCKEAIRASAAWGEHRVMSGSVSWASQCIVLIQNIPHFLCIMLIHAESAAVFERGFSFFLPVPLPENNPVLTPIPHSKWSCSYPIPLHFCPDYHSTSLLFSSNDLFSTSDFPTSYQESLSMFLHLLSLHITVSSANIIVHRFLSNFICQSLHQHSKQEGPQSGSFI